jgi:hypothetical protein
MTWISLPCFRILDREIWDSVGIHLDSRVWIFLVRVSFQGFLTVIFSGSSGIQADFCWPTFLLRVAFEEFLDAEFSGSGGNLGLEFGDWKWSHGKDWVVLRGLKSGFLEQGQPNFSRQKPDTPNEPIKSLEQIQGQFTTHS